MQMNLEGKVVLVTGSGKGIGKEVAHGFAREGANLILNDINGELLASAVSELQAQHTVKVFSVQGSMADPSDVSRMFAEIDAEFEHLDILVNNAAVLRDVRFLDMELSDWHLIFRNNLDSVLLATQHAAKRMNPERRPVVLNAGSFGGIIPTIGYSAYNATKAAITNLTQTMAGELNQLGIRVAGYIPGVTLTDIIRPMLQAEPERLVAQIPLKRLANPSDIADGVVFLASDRASYINGTMMEITGGKLCVQNVGR